MNRYRTALAVLLFAIATIFALGCSKEAPPRYNPPAAEVNPPTQTPETLKRLAEGQYISRMSAPLADLVRAQPWLDSMDPAHLTLLSALIDCERAAGARGEKQSVIDALSYATEQGWYQDGMDPTEAAGLRGVFQVYTESLSDQRAPAVGPVIASTIRYQLVNVMQLPESGEVVLMVSADDPAAGANVLARAAHFLPEVERISGKFPYTVLHLAVTDLPEFIAGVSYDEFIGIAPDYAYDDEVIAHELTHSTLYGIFPTWFEEGYAYFVGRYMTGQLEATSAEYKTLLARLKLDHRVRIGAERGFGSDYDIDSATGFLFMNALYEANGIEPVVETIRSLRSKTFNDQDLIRILVSTGTPEQQEIVKQVVCQHVLGSTRNYCR
jgi:hypothetical protein